MIPASAGIPALARLSDAYAGLLPLAMGEFTVHASLPEPWPSIVAAAREAGAVDFSGYYRLEPVIWPTESSSLELSRALWRPWPWLPELDPFLLMAHSYEDEICLSVGGQAWSVTDRALGSWLRQLPGLSIGRRPLENPLVVLTCTENVTHQALADQIGRLVWLPQGMTSISARPVDPVDRAAMATVVVGLHGTGDGRGGRFRSMYPQGGAGDRVRWAYRHRFGSSAVDWLVERWGGGSEASANARPLLFGGGRFRGLSYFDRRDRASRSAVLARSVLGSTYVAWTPNHAYQPGASAEMDQATEVARAAARPWDSQELGELPFNLDAAAVVVGYFANGRFGVYDEGRDVTYWEAPPTFGLRLRKDLAAAADGAARGRVPSRVVLLTDFGAMPARARADVARGIGGAELITVNAPSSLFLDEGPGSGGPRTRIALLPGISDVTAPEWTSTNSAGISTRLSPAPVRRTGGMRPAGAAPRRPVRHPGPVTGDQRHAGLGRAGRAGVPPRVRNEHHQQYGLAGPALGLEHSGALMRGAAGWRVRRRGAVPTWADLEALAYQTVMGTAAEWTGSRLGAAPGRAVGRCVALALAWRDTLFPGGIAASATADDLVAGRKGLLAGLVAAGGWVRVAAPQQVEAVLASAHAGLYAMVVWEPAGQVAGHATVWHAHRVGPAVRWMDLEAGQGRWMGPGGPPGFAAGHARAVFVSAAARVLDPAAATPADSADLSALLEFAPARPVTGNGKGKNKKKGKDKGKDKGEASSSSTPKTPKDIAKDYRNKTGPGAVLGRRNVAVALYDIDGYSDQLIGVSGTSDRPGSVGMPSSAVFDKNKPADAEWKILEELASRLYAESSGTVALYSEFPVCSSCQSVIQQFQDMFPGVGIDATSE